MKISKANKKIVYAIAWQLYNQNGHAIDLHDLQQEGLIAMWKAEQSFDGGRSDYNCDKGTDSKSFQIYLRSCVRNKLINYCKQQWTLINNLPLEGDIQAYDEALDVGSAIDHNKEIKQLRAAIELLPHKERFIIQQKYLCAKNLNSKQLRRELGGVSNTHLHRLKNKALKALKRKLSK